MRPSPGRPHWPRGTRVVTTGGRWPGRPAEVVRSHGNQLDLRILMPDGCTFKAVDRRYVRAVPHREGIEGVPPASGEPPRHPGRDERALWYGKARA